MAYNTNTTKTDAFQVITDRVISLLESGVAPWRKTWNAADDSQAPKNLISKKEYNGINCLILAAQGYNSPYWLTFNQAKEKGGHIRKGEKGTPVVFWRVSEKDDPKGEIDPKTGKVKKDKLFLLRYYTVFNVEQTEGINYPKPEKVEVSEVERIERAEAVIKNMPNPPSMAFGGNRAFYSPCTDSVKVPTIDSYEVKEHYYGTVFHELSHSTGHRSRLNRSGVAEAHFFGDEEYSKEELIAEMASAFLCGHCGIENITIENSASYLQNWINALKGDKRLVVHAASAAQKAANYILGKKEVKEEEEETAE